MLNTVRDRALTARVYELATAHKALINSYDNPAYSNIGMVALVHPGHLRLSISTSNASPALSSRLRQDSKRFSTGNLLRTSTIWPRRASGCAPK